MVYTKNKYYNEHPEKLYEHQKKYFNTENGRRIKYELNNAYAKRRNGNQLMIWLFEFRRMK